MTERNLRLVYFAMLKECAGVSGEELRTSAKTARELYAELRASRGFSLGETDLRVAINGEFADLDNALCDGDEISFIPPVSGG